MTVSDGSWTYLVKSSSVLYTFDANTKVFFLAVQWAALANLSSNISADNEACISRSFSIPSISEKDRAENYLQIQKSI